MQEKTEIVTPVYDNHMNERIEEIRDQKILQEYWELSISRIFTPATLFPTSSRLGPKRPIPHLPGTAPITPPETPLLAGMPTLMANSPERLYIPHVTMKVLQILAVSFVMMRLPDPPPHHWQRLLRSAPDPCSSFQLHIVSYRDPGALPHRYRSPRVAS